ncbi:hypothetical protein ABLN97_07495 [Mycobacterium tuberculosis]
MPALAAFCSAVLYTFSNTLGTDTTAVKRNTANIGSVLDVAGESTVTLGGRRPY